MLGNPSAQRVALYMRVSTYRQELEETVETQRFWLEDHARRMGCEIAAVYIDENCPSHVPFGERAEGGRLMREAAQRGFDAILVYRLDRVSRYRTVFYAAADALAKLDLGFQSMHERFETATPMGRLALAMLVAFNEYERESIHQRTTDGMQRTAAQGGHNGGPTPYGFRVVGKKPRFLAIDEEPLEGLDWCESSVVRYIYYLAGELRWGGEKIANELNAIGIPTAIESQNEHKSRQHWKNKTVSGLWRPERIAQILRNPLYKGERYYGKHTIKDGKLLVTPERATMSAVPAIVTPEAWDKARATADSHQRFCQRNGKRLYLLRGLIKCGACGMSYCGGATGSKSLRRDGTPRVQHLYYSCVARTRPQLARKQALAPCRNPAVRCDRIEADLWETLVACLHDVDGTRHKLDERRGDEESRRADLLRARDGILAERERLEKRKDNLIDSIADGVLTKAEAQEKLLALRDLIRAQEERLPEIDREMAALRDDGGRLDAAQALLERYRDRLTDEMTWEEKREYIEVLVERITVTATEEGGTHCVYRFTFEPIDNRMESPSFSNRFPLTLEITRLFKRAA